jgi:hypothetical protein|tara:strand:- start:520 stop:1245 length:726 start_codon:yes stop_codon:yes gene_type:complete
MFFNKSIKLTAYTSDLSVYTNCKPAVGKDVKTPGWLKNISASVKSWNQDIGLYDKAGTVAICPGIREYFSTPITLSMWSEIDIRINPDGSWSSTSQSRPDLNTNIAEHSEDQWKGMYPGKRIALKLDSPWRFKSNCATKFLFSESHYSTSYFREKDVWLSPGVTNFKYQHSTNIHLNCPVKEETYVMTLKYGMPLISLFPMTERAIDFECKRVPFDEYISLGDHMPRVPIGKYYKQPDIKK